jgi:hypothetical protein
MSFLLLIGLLLGGVVSLEIPEFVTLTDDVSNDFTVHVCSNEIAPPTVNNSAAVAQPAKIRIERREHSIPLFPSVTAPRLPRHLLRLFSIQRE